MTHPDSYEYLTNTVNGTQALIWRAAAAVLCGALLTPVGASASSPLTPDDQAAALLLEDRIADNLWYGQVFEATYRTPDRTPGDLASVHNFGDSALWTGTYLAAEAFRYATARTKIATGEDVAFWGEQQAEAKARIDQIVAKYHLLINISKNWDYELEPSLDPPSFGGGVFRGEPGYLMRACIPTDAPSWATWGEPRGPRVFGPLDWDDGNQYWCEDATSRDAYAGTTFGLLTAFDLVGPDDDELRAQIRDDVITMTTFALKYLWNTPRPHGNISLPPEDLEEYSPVDVWGHDFENFISPLFVYVPMARLNMTQIARHVADEAGTPEQAAFWEAVWAEELASQGSLLATSMEIDSFQPNDGYYKFNLHHLTGYTTIRLEPDPAVRELLRQAFSVMDNTTRDDVNAHFETITYALTGEAGRRDLAIEHLREWLDYRARIDLGVPTNNSPGCDVEFECVARDSLELVVRAADGSEAAAVTLFPGTDARLRARRPLPVPLRPPTDFLWQRPPTQLEGFEGATRQAPGIDYLLPYWMLRYYTDVAPPGLSPFPPYPAPAHA